MNNKLTIRQEYVLNKVKGYIKEFGFPPSHVDIAKMIDVKSTKAAADYLRAIEKKGYIKIHPKISRGIQVLVMNSEVE